MTSQQDAPRTLGTLISRDCTYTASNSEREIVCQDAAELIAVDPRASCEQDGIGGFDDYLKGSLVFLPEQLENHHCYRESTGDANAIGDHPIHQLRPVTARDHPFDARGH